MDTLFKGAVIYDGSGEAPFKGDVGVTKGRISAIHRAGHGIGHAHA